MTEYSMSPAGEKFALPRPEEYAEEYQRLDALVQAARKQDKEIVVVMGVGFVGAVMAAIIADTTDKKTGRPGKFVIGCQRPSTPSHWKKPIAHPRPSPRHAGRPHVAHRKHGSGRGAERSSPFAGP